MSSLARLNRKIGGDVLGIADDTEEDKLMTKIRGTIAPEPPAPPKERKPIPVAGGAEEREAKRSSIRRQGKRRGRKSTVLTALSDDKLGG